MYTRQSSRGRSRSRSFSPQADVRHSSSVRPHSRTPPGRVNRSRSPPSSSQSYIARAPPRGRSVSSLSSGSWSRSRSSSRSPGDRPRTKHRLPPATSIRDISLSISKTALQQRPNFILNQESETTGNEKANANGNHTVCSFNGFDQVWSSPFSQDAPSASPGSGRRSSERMPPPIIPPTSDSRPQEIVITPSGTQQRRDADSPTRTKFPKSAGFKPIGLASSSVKMFFPGDDQEHHGAALERHELPAHPGIPTKRVHDDVAVDQVEYSRQTIGKHHSQPIFLPPQEAIPVPAEVIPGPQPPSPTVHDATKVPVSPKANGDLVTPAPQLRLSEPDVDAVTRPSSPSITSRKELYAIVSQVGEGTFGKVYKARNTITNVHVALKRIRMEAERDGFPVTAMREIKLLQSLKHQNIVRLYEMMVSNGKIIHTQSSTSLTHM